MTMRSRRFACVVLLLVVSCSMAFAQRANSPGKDLGSILRIADTAPYKDGELLVKFKPVIGSPQASRTHWAIGGKVLHGFSFINVDHVALPQGLPVKDAIARYMLDPNVEYAEPNYIVTLADFAASPVIPNDPYFGSQWAWLNTGQLGGISGADISATLAWDITTGSRDVAIAVLDSGIDYNHPDLKDNIDLSLCHFSDATTGCDDYLGHGTFVSGVIGAVGNNGTGVTGVMWKVNLVDVKVLDDSNGLSAKTILDGFDYVIKLNKKGISVRAMNASFIGPFSNAVFEAAARADDAGILIAAAAGNEAGSVPMYPAAFNLPNIISVAATDPNDNLAYFSNFGASWVDVAAPGVDIFSTGPTHPNLFGFRYYAFGSGTSTSAPMVTGLAGLLATQYPYFTHHQIRSTILRYVDVLPSLHGLVSTGGRINAYKAVSSLLAPTNLKVNALTPSGAHLSWTDNATGEDFYLVERSTCNGPFSQMAVLGPDQTSFKDATVSGNSAYTYRVSAFNTIPAQSQYSNLAVVGNVKTAAACRP